MLSAVAMLILVAPAQMMVPDLHELRRIPPEQRCAYVNRLMPETGKNNALRAYQRAHAQFKVVFQLKTDDTPDALRNSIDDVEKRIYRLISANAWSESEQRILADWLAINAATLAALKDATASGRLRIPYPEGTTRMADARPGLRISALVSGATLAAIQANACALDGDWDAAYAWNGRIRRIADHAYQQPSSIWHSAGVRVEWFAYRQLLSFLWRRPPADLATLQERLRADGQLHAQPEAVEIAETLLEIDYIEQFYEWSQDPEANSQAGDLVRMFIVEDDAADDFREAVRDSYLRDEPRAPPFETVEAFRAALARSSVEGELEVLEQLRKLAAKWHAVPFWQAWAKVSEFHRAYAEAAQAAPSLALFACTASIPPPSHARRIDAEAGARRCAARIAVALYAHQKQHGDFPDTLDALPAALLTVLPPDPYSGEPLKYRRLQSGFLLYSIGPDQQDDGGWEVPDSRATGDIVYWPEDRERSRES